MSHTYTRLTYHCIFATVDRRPLLSEDICERVYGYIRGIAREIDANLIAVGGTADHVHLLLELPATLTIADAMRLIKTNSSKWVCERLATHADFGWQTGYAAFTVSASAVDKVAAYIANQEMHHRMRTFDDEFEAFLNRHGLEKSTPVPRKPLVSPPEGGSWRFFLRSRPHGSRRGLPRVPPRHAGAWRSVENVTGRVGSVARRGFAGSTSDRIGEGCFVFVRRGFANLNAFRFASRNMI